MRQNAPGERAGGRSAQSLADLLVDGDPDALVVRAGAETLTRAELVRDATAVRDALVAAGVGPG